MLRRSLKLYLAVIYDAEYEYQLIQLSGPERKKEQQESAGQAEE